MKVINSLSQLKAWNMNPTKNFPIVLDWFLDWFFEELLMKNKTEEALDARETMIEFCMKCEFFDRLQAIDRTDSNFRAHAVRGHTTWFPKWQDFQNILRRA